MSSSLTSSTKNIKRSDKYVMDLERAGFCLYDAMRHYRVRTFDGDYLIPWEAKEPPTYEQVMFAINEYWRCNGQFEYNGVKKFW